MSKRLFERLELTSFNAALTRIRNNQITDKELELEYERVTGKECDNAATYQSTAEFQASINEAIKNILRRRQKKPEEIIYA